MRRLTSILLAAACAGACLADEGHDAPVVIEAAPTVALVNTGVIGALIAAAEPGDTVRVPPGVYREHLRIEKPIVLAGEGNAVIDGGGDGDIVEIVAPDVTIRGFVLRDTGIDLDRENVAIRVSAPRATIEDNVLDDVLFGIDLKQAPGAVIRGNRIGGKQLDVARRGDGLRLWRSDDALIEGNTIHDGRDAILWYSNRITVRANRCLDSRYGLHLMFSDDVVLEDNELTGNSVGVYFMYSKGLTLRGNRMIRNRGPSGYGIGLKETDQFTIENNVIAGNRVGVYIDGSPFTKARPGRFTHNLIASNDVGLTLLPAVRGNQFTGNNFVENLEQVSVQGRGQVVGNDFALNEHGNFWSDYTGYDSDGDGLGEYEHESQKLFENLMDKEPKLRLFLFSPAQQAVEFVGRAIPAVRPEAKFTDPWPLTRPVDIVLKNQVPPARRGLAGVAIALVTTPAVLAACAFGTAGLRGARRRIQPNRSGEAS